MRKFKFKVWSNLKSEFVTPMGINADSLGNLFYKIDYFDVGHYVICQYTGLKDKDEKEAFEGDIVDVGKGNIYFIEFRYGEFRLYSFGARNNGGEYSISIGAHLKDSEIIGNIYQNPELLEKNHE